MVRVILLSQYPLPYAKIGSWTNMYKSYLQGSHQIDYIICENPEERFPDVNYKIVENTFFLKVRRRLHNFFRIGFIDALEKVIAENKGEKFIIQVIDNFNIAVRINEMLVRKGIRKDCAIQVFYHGFAPFIDIHKFKNFYENIDELVLLTNGSYKAHKAFYTVFPCKVSLLPNGIDTKKFYKPTDIQQQNLKVSHGYEDKKVFIWCSQDRPKKGLSLMLEAWKKVYEKHKDIVFLVIGAKRDVAIDGVVFMGRIPNSDLPEFYQMADCYLFPTLCHEGFGLSLIEALNCGCYCIASKAGGVPEVLHHGKYGKLIENPNFVSEWETAINDYLSGKEKPVYGEGEMYTITEWISNINTIISNAKNNIS